MKPFVILGLACSFLALPVLALANDEGPTWVVSARLGPAWTDADAIDAAGTRTGFSMEVGAGLAIRKNLVLAVEGDLLRRGNKWTGAVWLPSATLYPGLGGLYLRAGLGVSNIESIERVDPETGLPIGEDVETQTEASGFGVMTGLGYDWAVAENLLFGPRLRIGWLNLDDDDAITFYGASVGGSYRW